MDGMKEIKVIRKNGDIRSVKISHQGLSGSCWSKSGKTEYRFDEKASTENCAFVYRQIRK